MSAQDKPLRLFVASSNQGKLREYHAMAEAAGARVQIESIPNFGAVAVYEETARTFAENAVGKALYYSRYCDGLVLADDSGLVVPALGGAPGVHSARYAGPGASDADRIRKLLAKVAGKTGDERDAQFVCVTVLAEAGEAHCIFSASADGVLLSEPRGTHGFGYDPVFFFRELNKTYAEISPEEKNMYSHRGKAFRKALDFLHNENQKRAG